MNKDINLQPNGTKFDITKFDNGTVGVFCTKSVVLNIYDKSIEFVAGNLAICAKDDTYNQSFGKALAWIRASKDIGNQIENYLIKYSCKPINSKIGDLEVNVKLNTESFEKSLKRLANKVEDINNQIKGRESKVNCKIFGEDGFISNLRIDVAEPEGTTLDKLVGKWAIRTKPVIKKNGYEDKSYSNNDPIFVKYATNKYIGFNMCDKDDSYKYQFTYGGYDNDFLDNNWIEYKKEKTLKEKALDLIDKGYNLVPLCSKDHSGMNNNHISKCLTPGKSVLVKNWELDNYISSKEDIESWFSVNPHIGIGIVKEDINGIKYYKEVK
jgi:hypothetical protein